MNEASFSEFYDSGKRAHGADILKFWLMPFVMFVLFGLPTRFGGYIRPFMGFAAPAFYILCGFFVLCPDEAVRAVKIKKALKKSFKFFALLFVLYLLLNIFYFAIVYNYMGVDLLKEIVSKRVIFDFFVFNLWPVTSLPIGNSIWFIQSLFYAYIFFLIADKLKLLRFCTPIFIIFSLIMLFTGEFSALAGFPYFGYGFIPGGAMTRAIPYMLLGMLVRKHADRLLGFRGIYYVLLFLIGAALAYLELRVLTHFNILTYTGHIIGLGIMALSVCLLALSETQTDASFIAAHGRSYAKRIYALCQPVYTIILIILPSVLPAYSSYIAEYLSIIIYLVCLLFAFLIGLVKFTFNIGN